VGLLLFGRLTTPGEVVRVPQIGPADSHAVARGKEIYLSQGCDKCHGLGGVGAWDEPMFDEEGHPTRPRDLVHEPFKGGGEPQSVYLRNFPGMPGTPHPASVTLSARQLIDLVHYCRSLSREPRRLLTNHQRAAYSTSRAYLSAFQEAPEP
jgi:mono/diheme cytochrome c family protein